ncbi:MAG TPA: hypothetical protein VKY92_22320, partial [Verrucomicrobiae bacterium]|nr:hypothetical protein [Verrucomicrobiae bacterium]
MTKEEIFAAWSPDVSVWATWVKPVLFAHMDAATPVAAVTGTAYDVGWASSIEERTAMVLDLPKDEGVWLAIALAGRGYRPVPLYNAIPLPFGAPVSDPASQRPVAAVDVVPIVSALRQGADQLGGLKIPRDAPPAFLLDANRQGTGVRMLPDEFDNRSVCFTTDFPSANYLITHGIKGVLLVQRERFEPQTDLAHVLRRWQEAGLPLQRMRIEQPTERERFQVKRPSWYRAMFQRVLVAFGLKRAPGGGFGAW